MWQHILPTQIMAYKLQLTRFARSNNLWNVSLLSIDFTFVMLPYPKIPTNLIFSKCTFVHCIVRLGWSNLWVYSLYIYVAKFYLESEKNNNMHVNCKSKLKNPVYRKSNKTSFVSFFCLKKIRRRPWPWTQSQSVIQWNSKQQNFLR